MQQTEVKKAHLVCCQRSWEGSKEIEHLCALTTTYKELQLCRRLLLWLLPTYFYTLKIVWLFFYAKIGILYKLPFSISSAIRSSSFIRGIKNGKWNILLESIVSCFICKIGHFSKTLIWFEGRHNLKSYCSRFPWQPAMRFPWVSGKRRKHLLANSGGRLWQ